MVMLVKMELIVVFMDVYVLLIQEMLDFSYLCPWRRFVKIVVSIEPRFERVSHNYIVAWVT